jgi:hypothetical protein
MVPFDPLVPFKPVVPVAPASPCVHQVKVRSLFLQFLFESISRIAPPDFLAQALIDSPAALLTPTESSDAPSTMLMPMIREFFVEDVLIRAPNF